MKYYGKRYLRKQHLRDFVRMMSNGKDRYIMKYYQIINDDGADSEEEMDSD